MFKVCLHIKPANLSTDYKQHLNNYKLTDFFTTTKKRMRTQRVGTTRYHPLFGATHTLTTPLFGVAVIGRCLEAAGYKVAIVPQPDWHGDFRDFKKTRYSTTIFWYFSGLYGLDGEQIYSQQNAYVLKMRTAQTADTIAVQTIQRWYIRKF